MDATPTLFDLLGQVPDPRRAEGKRHPLPAVLSLLVLAMLAGMRVGAQQAPEKKASTVMVTTGSPAVAGKPAQGAKSTVPSAPTVTQGPLPPGVTNGQPATT